MKRLTIIISSSVLYKAVTLITNFIIQRKILLSFGSDINGITSSIQQFITYLVLLEAGLGTASIQALYKPLHDKNWTEINGILSATSRYYKKISLYFGVSLLGLAFLVPLLVAEQLNVAVVFGITILSGLSSLFTYLIAAKYTVLLNADRKINVVYLIDSILAIISCILRIIAIELGFGIIIVTSILALIAGVKSLLLFVYIRLTYKKLDLRVAPEYDKVGKHKSVLIHQLAGAVVSHTDITILTVLSTLKIVSVYTVYNFIYSNLSSIISTVFQHSTQAFFGHLAADGKEIYNRYYSVYEFSYNLILYIILTVALIMTLPFVSLYTAGITDIEYLDNLLPILFCISQFLNLIRIPSLMTITAFGTFEETQKGAIIEVVINLTVSLLLFPFLGIYGLLIGTVCSYLYRTQDCIRFSYKYCGLNLRNLVANNLPNLIGSCILILVFKRVIPTCMTNWVDWVIYSIGVFAATIIMLLLVNLVFNYSKYKSVYTILKTTQRNNIAIDSGE